MKISMEVLAEDLKDILCDVHIIGDSPMSLKGVRFLENTSEDFSSYVYVGQKVPPRIPESFNMICISGEQQAEFPESCSVLTVKEIDNELALFNRLLDTFQKYDEWERTLGRLLQEHAPIEAFLEESQPILKAGICLMDWNHDVIAATRVKIGNSPLWDAIQDGYGYKYKFIIEQSNPKLMDLTQAGKMSQNWSNLDNRYLCNLPLFFDGFAMFGLGMHKIEEPTKKFGRGQTQLFEKLGEVITQRLEYNQTRRARNTFQNTFMRDIVLGNVKNPDLLNDENKYIVFSKTDYFAVGLISLENEDFRSSFLESCAQELEHVWPGSIWCVLECRLLGLINLKEYEDVQLISGSLMRALANWLEGKKAYCGFSASFQRLANMAQGYQEAKSTLQYGMLLDVKSGRRIFRFYDHLDYQLIGLAAKNVDVTSFVHPVLRTLLRFDQKHATDYYTTLAEYLVEETELTFNEIADKLHVHRNTLRYRIDKICEITGITLSDVTMKQQILFSLLCSKSYPAISLKSALK